MGKGGMKIQFYMQVSCRMNKSEDSCSKTKKVHPSSHIHLYVPKIMIFQNVGESMTIATI